MGDIKNRFTKRLNFALATIKQKGLISGVSYLGKWYYANIRDLPHEVNFESTATCNLKCHFCYPHSTRDFAKRTKMTMSFELYKKIIDDIK